MNLSLMCLQNLAATESFCVFMYSFIHSFTHFAMLLSQLQYPGCELASGDKTVSSTVLNIAAFSHLFPLSLIEILKGTQACTIIHDIQEAANILQKFSYIIVFHYCNIYKFVSEHRMAYI